MEQLLALIILVIGVIIVLVFAPLAWRKAAEEAGVDRAAFARVLTEEIQELETRMAQLRQEYRSLSRQVEARQATPVPPEQVERVQQGGDREREPAGQLPEIELYRRVFQAYDAGKSVTEIAKDLGRGKGEIELILNLRR
ncbi:MAG TPA: hypothetical protein GXX34_11295 [Clostridia bacterium]|nr:hypothetical protein [Clostridia bacterium]